MNRCRPKSISWAANLSIQNLSFALRNPIDTIWRCYSWPLQLLLRTSFWQLIVFRLQIQNRFFAICRNHILPICLPGKYIDLKGRHGIIAGWGKTDLSTGHTGTAILQMASVPIISKYLFHIRICTEWSLIAHPIQVQPNASIGMKRRTFSSNCMRKCFVLATRMEGKTLVWVRRRAISFIRIGLSLLRAMQVTAAVDSFWLKMANTH